MSWMEKNGKSFTVERQFEHGIKPMFEVKVPVVVTHLGK